MFFEKTSDKVKNTGKVAGAEVCQLYVSDVDSSVERPLKELKEFTKVWLEPGEAQEVKLTLTPRAFRYYDTSAGDWRVEPGEFVIRVGGSSANLPLSEKINM